MTTVDSARIRVTVPRVVASEWTKMRSVPSTLWSLAATVAIVVGLGVIYALVRVTRPPRDPAALASFDPTAVSLSGVSLAQVAVGVLGVLLITGEYASGTIRTTMAAVPGRIPVLWAKAVVLSLGTVVLSVPACFVAFAIGQSTLAREHLDISISAHGVLRAVVGGALYLGAVGLLGLALGALLRHTAGGVAALIGMLFLPQILVGFLPEAWSDRVYPYLPAPAGQAITTVRSDALTLAPWTGLGLLIVYAAVLLGTAAWLLRRRDV